MFKLDKKDYRILFELDVNSRQSINELAKKTRLSRDVVNYRIKQLQNKGVIKKFITVIDFSKFGYQIVRLYLKFQNTTSLVEEEIVKHFLKQDNIITVYRIDGKYDLAVGFLVNDLHEYQQVYEDFLKGYRTFVAEKDFTIFTDYIHYHRNYLVEKKQQNYDSLSTGSFKKFDYDRNDLLLLKEISENSRISLLELAKKLNMTATGVKYKLKNLEKSKVIVGYKLLLNTNLLNYSYYKVDLEVEDINIISTLKEFVTVHQNVVYRNVVVGGSDFEFDCELKSQNDFYKLINEIKALFPKKIRNYFYYRALKIYKYSYFPETLLQ